MDDVETEIPYREITIDDLVAMGFGVKRAEPTERAVDGRKTKPPLPPTTLRRSQLRALAVLAECEATSGSSGITLEQMSKRAKVSEQTLKQGLGAIDPSGREKHDTLYGFLSLLTQGLVMVVEAGGEYRYYLSVLGQSRCDDIEDKLTAIRKTRPNTGGLINRTGPKTPKPNRKVWKKQAAKRTQADVEIVTDPL